MPLRAVSSCLLGFIPNAQRISAVPLLMLSPSQTFKVIEVDTPGIMTPVMQLLALLHFPSKTLVEEDVKKHPLALKRRSMIPFKPWLVTIIPAACL